MPTQLKKDTREKLWRKLELQIQKRAKKKDRALVQKGGWKKFARKTAGFKVYAVDGEYVRNNLSVTFAHGGHGYVHEFIPLDEIWIAIHHFKKCGCKKRTVSQKFSQEYFDSTVIHEIAEFEEIKNGKIYWKAHQIALAKERELGLLKDPYSDI